MIIISSTCCDNGMYGRMEIKLLSSVPNLEYDVSILR